MSLFDSGIRPVINDHLLKLSREKRDYGDYWSASSAGYCMRRQIMERLGVPHTNEDARKQRVFSSGHIFHEWIQGITKATGLSIAQELELQDEDLMVRGHIDDLVLVGGKKEPVVETFDEGTVSERTIAYEKPAQHLILYDYKTVHSRSFHWQRKNGSPMSYYHMMQLGTYMYMLRHGSEVIDMGEFVPAPLLSDLTEARVLKLSKDDLSMMEEQLLWSDQLRDEVVAYWTVLNEYWTNRKIPPCSCKEYENGFMAKQAYNPYWFEGEPCNIKLLVKFKEEKDGRPSQTKV